jgi:hypothetical protein
VIPHFFPDFHGLVIFKKWITAIGIVLEPRNKLARLFLSINYCFEVLFSNDTQKQFVKRSMLWTSVEILEPFLPIFENIKTAS